MGRARKGRPTLFGTCMSLRIRLPFLLAALLLPRLASADEHSIDLFEHHDDVRVELFAQEPDVVDPVSLSFAANGDCFVLEMRDYPAAERAYREALDISTHGLPAEHPDRAIPFVNLGRALFCRGRRSQWRWEARRGDVPAAFDGRGVSQ